MRYKMTQIGDYVPLEQEFIDKLQEKIASLALLDHPHLARLQNAYLQDEHCYLAYDWLSFAGEPCMTLQDLAEEKDREEEVIKQIALQIASALDYIHEHSLAHLGIKASNVLIDFSQKDPFAYLTDTGLSSLFPSHLFLLGVLEECSKELGSDHNLSSFWESFYGLAPEQKKGNPCFASDVYAFGVRS